MRHEACLSSLSEKTLDQRQKERLKKTKENRVMWQWATKHVDNQLCCGPGQTTLTLKNPAKSKTWEMKKKERQLFWSEETLIQSNKPPAQWIRDLPYSSEVMLSAVIFNSLCGVSSNKLFTLCTSNYAAQVVNMPDQAVFTATETYQLCSCFHKDLNLMEFKCLHTGV